MPSDDVTKKDVQLASDDFDARVTSIAVLAEPVRRALYRFVVGQSQPVSREEAATGTEMALHTAKFHLDKLVDDGLLDVEYRRPPGRGGPGSWTPLQALSAFLSGGVGQRPRPPIRVGRAPSRSGRN